MIVKQYESKPASGDPRRDAGHLAEKQMAHYLHRAFAQDPELFVLNDIRIVDPGQQGFVEEDACQIDHLVLHRWGIFIIESKSCTGIVRIRDDGSGGDEWEFPAGRGSEGRGSPLKQAHRQADYLRTFVQSHREDILGKVKTGFRMLAKVIAGTDQRGVTKMPMQAIVAISEKGRLDRSSWKPRTEPHADYVCKADLVVDKIKAEFTRHKKVNGPIPKVDGDYGMWSMKPEEAEAMASFLAKHHTPLPAPKRATKPAPAPVARNPTPAPPPKEPTLPPPSSRCKSCDGANLSGNYGKYGYYWKCAECNTNTAMPRVCAVCGEDGSKSKGVRIRKDGPKYFRSCESCSIEECIWTDRVS